MTPEQALRRVIHCLDRVHETGFKTKAFVRALDVVRNTDPSELADRAANDTLTDLDGSGSSTAAVIADALAGERPSYLDKIEAESVVPITDEGRVYRDALRGDCHMHSTWSDGGAPIEAMAATAIDLVGALAGGAGAALALNILRAALECHNGMATFAEAAVSGA